MGRRSHKIIVDVAAKLKIEPEDVFLFAAQELQKPKPLDLAAETFAIWKDASTHPIPDWLMDFCIDVMTEKVVL